MPTAPRRPARSASPLSIFAGFAFLAAASAYAFQKLAYQRGRVLQPGQEKQSKDYRQY